MIARGAPGIGEAFQREMKQKIQKTDLEQQVENRQGGLSIQRGRDEARRREKSVSFLKWPKVKERRSTSESLTVQDAVWMWPF